MKHLDHPHRLARTLTVLFATLAFPVVGAAQTQPVSSKTSFGSQPVVSSQRFRPLLQEPAHNPSLGHDPSDNPAGVLLHSGEFVLERTDMRIRGRSRAWTLTRVYRSGSEYSTALGHGWDANVFERLVVGQGAKQVWHYPGNGRVERYFSNASGDYDSPAGFFTKLRSVPSGWELRDRYGDIKAFSLDGRILSCEQRNGDRITFQYSLAGELSSVTDSFGRQITFSYLPSGRLGSVTDFSGRSITYAYNTQNQLQQAASPIVSGTVTGNDFPAGQRERYVYGTGSNHPRLIHNLTAIIAPNEVENGSLTPRTTLSYGTTARTFDRVLSVTVGGTNASGVPAGGTATYAYDWAPAGAPMGTFVRTTVTDRRGQVTEYDHNAAGHAIRIEEGANLSTSFETTREFNADGLCTRLVLPMGNETQWVYDSGNPDRFQQGNRLEERRIPDGARGGDQAQLLTTYTYEPLFNQLSRCVKPRGNDAGYIPQNGGVASAARYTEHRFYDYQENATAPALAADWGIMIPAGLLSLGDLNQDGLIDQAMGNLVLETKPDVQLLPGSQQAAAEGSTIQEIEIRRRYNGFGQLVELEDPRGNIELYEYHPEQDPDGDGSDLIAGRDPLTGGYRFRVTEDAFLGVNRQDPGPAQTLVVESQLDSRGNVVASTDANGNVRIVTFNALDQPIREEDPRVHPAQSHGYRRDVEYDANNNVVARVVENWGMDPTGLPVLDSSNSEFRHLFLYDILDNQIESTQDAQRDSGIPASLQPETLVTRFEYDANENVVRVETPEATVGSDPGNTVTHVYDERDLVIQTTRGAGSSTPSTETFEYDANDNLVRHSDAEDNDTTPGNESDVYIYDGYDRLVQSNDRAGNATLHTYDPDGRTTRTERHGPINGVSPFPVLLEGTDYLYDELGRFDPGRP